MNSPVTLAGGRGLLCKGSASSYHRNNNYLYSISSLPTPSPHSQLFNIYITFFIKYKFILIINYCLKINILDYSVNLKFR